MSGSDSGSDPGRLQGSVHRYDAATTSGSVLLDDGRELGFDAPVFLASALRHLRVGQRVSLELRDERLTRLWLVGIGPGERIR